MKESLPFKQIPGTKQVLLDFPMSGIDRSPQYATSQRTLCATVHRPFLPLGILLWGVTEDSYVTRLQVGAMSEGSVSGAGRIPATCFATDRALTELRRMAELGELPGAVNPRSVMQMEEATIGARVSLEVTGPLRDACLWGLTYTDGYPYSEVRIDAVPLPENHSTQGIFTESFTGVVREHTLGGERDRCKITAPTVEAVTALLAAFSRQSKPSW